MNAPASQMNANFLLTFAARGCPPPPHPLDQARNPAMPLGRVGGITIAHRPLSDAEQRLFKTITARLCQGRGGRLVAALAKATFAFAVVEIPRGCDPSGLAMAIRSCLAKHSRDRGNESRVRRNLATSFRIEELFGELAIEAVCSAMERLQADRPGA